MSAWQQKKKWAFPVGTSRVVQLINAAAQEANGMKLAPVKANSKKSAGLFPNLIEAKLQPSRWQEALSNLACMFAPPAPPPEGILPVNGRIKALESRWYKRLLENGKLVFSRRAVWGVRVQPVEVPELFTEYRFHKTSWVLSLAVHMGVLGMALYIPASIFNSTKPVTHIESLTLLNHQALVLHLPAMSGQSGGGGGGGRREKTRASLGRLPRFSDRQLTPPTPKVVSPKPVLVVEPTLVVPQLASLPSARFSNYGDPLGVPGPPSSGPGTGGGIGDGNGGGVGPGKGPGWGPGEGGGTGGGVYRVGGGVRPPTVLFRVEPNYTEEARKAHYEGTVLFSAIVRRNGRLEVLKVLRGLGLGLDENAVAALMQWKFNPGTRNGEPVDVALNVEVNFILR